MEFIIKFLVLLKKFRSMKYSLNMSIYEKKFSCVGSILCYSDTYIAIVWSSNVLYWIIPLLIRLLSLDTQKKKKTEKKV